jgi:hypothetical protein
MCPHRSCKGSWERPDLAFSIHLTKRCVCVCVCVCVVGVTRYPLLVGLEKNLVFTAQELGNLEKFGSDPTDTHVCMNDMTTLYFKCLSLARLWRICMGSRMDVRRLVRGHWASPVRHVPHSEKQ